MKLSIERGACAAVEQRAAASLAQHAAHEARRRLWPFASRPGAAQQCCAEVVGAPGSHPCESILSNPPYAIRHFWVELRGAHGDPPRV